MRNIRHPEYDNLSTVWKQWRATYKGGRDFVNNYLKKFSARESNVDFAARKVFTYCAAFAKMAVNDVKNAIFQRITDVQRLNGPASYMDAVEGKKQGVDLRMATMGSFIGREVLPELLVMAKVGVFIDRAPITVIPTKAAKPPAPYLYIYEAERILSWTYNKTDRPWQYDSVLLKDTVDVVDPESGLPKDTVDQYRLMRVVTNPLTGRKYVHVTIYDDNDVKIKETILNLDRIPFVVFEINESLMADIADYQVALTNASSSDIAYILKANYPFYTEQKDARTSGAHLKKKGSTDSTDDDVSLADAAVETGVHHGRTYGKGMDRPGFIAPPTEPLIASMKKQDEMKADIRRLINLTLSGLQPKAASAESKGFDVRGLEAGLSYIGLELEHGERQISQLWAMYEGVANATTIKYPEKYSLKTDSVVLDEVEKLEKRMMAVPSMTYKQEIAKQIVTTLLGPKVSNETLEKIKKEIDDAEILTTALDVMTLCIEEGLISHKSAAKALGIPEGEVEQAAKDHEERAARILLAQTAAAAGADARGVGDVDPNDKGAEEEKV